MSRVPIAVFIPSIGTGGAEKQAALLANVLADEYAVHYVVWEGDWSRSERVKTLLEKPEISIYFLKGTFLAKARAFHKILSDHHIQYAFNYLTKCDFVGSLIEKSSGVKYVYNGIRNSSMEWWKVALEWFSHNIISTATIFNSYSGEEVFIKKGFKAEKCITIPNCMESLPVPVQRENKAYKRIITVARFHPQKDYETLVRTVAELVKKRDDVALDIVGCGPLETQIRAWVEDYGIAGIVCFHIDPDNIQDLLNQADIYLSTSLFEGTSNSIMEAMCACLPVVATDVGDNHFLVKDGVNGRLNGAGDYVGLSLSVGSLLDDFQMRLDMGAAGYRIIEEKYSLNEFRLNYQKLLS